MDVMQTTVGRVVRHNIHYVNLRYVLAGLGGCPKVVSPPPLNPPPCLWPPAPGRKRARNAGFDHTRAWVPKKGVDRPPPAEYLSPSKDVQKKKCRRPVSWPAALF